MAILLPVLAKISVTICTVTTFSILPTYFSVTKANLSVSKNTSDLVHCFLKKKLLRRLLCL